MQHDLYDENKNKDIQAQNHLLLRTVMVRFVVRKDDVSLSMKFWLSTSKLSYVWPRPIPFLQKKGCTLHSTLFRFPKFKSEKEPCPLCLSLSLSLPSSKKKFPKTPAGTEQNGMEWITYLCAQTVFREQLTHSLTVGTN